MNIDRPRRKEVGEARFYPDGRLFLLFTSRHSLGDIFPPFPLAVI